MRKYTALFGTGVVTAAALVALAPGASAAVCGTGWRYAASTDTVYLTSGSQTLSDLALYCPQAPLVMADAATKTWELNSDLVVQSGATLVLHGTAAGGDVDNLRLQSLASDAPNDITQITAQAGTIDIASVKVTSWDGVNGPDTNTTLRDGAPAGSQARAFIRAVSFKDAVTGAKNESTMNIVDSDLGYLGWYDAESYGVAYKARGCDAANLDECNSLNVYGKQLNSRFHHNYMGTYTYNAYGMTFDSSQYDNNITYGLDPHDDSDYLTITKNRFNNNGLHGLICSQRCNNLTITDNESDHNGVTPFIPPGDLDPTDNQVHGIMLHRGVTATVVRNNNVHDQPNGAGIAIFDSTGAEVSGNSIVGNKYGVRLSVGSNNSAITNNVISNSSLYGVYAYQGSDIPTYSALSGRPTNNVFKGNSISNSTTNAVKLTDTDGTVFNGTRLLGTNGPLRFDRSVGTKFFAGTGVVPAQTAFETRGSSTSAGSTSIAEPRVPVRVTTGDSYSTTDITSTTGTVFTVVNGVKTVVSPASRSLLRLTSALVGSGAVTVSATPVKLALTRGKVTASATGWSAGKLSVSANVSIANTAVTFKVAGGKASSRYTVTVSGVVVASGTTDAAGSLTFTSTRPTTAITTYQIATS